MRDGGFTLLELLSSTAIALILGTLMVGAGGQVLKSSALATSASNLRQLAAGMSSYLGENNQSFWRYRENVLGQGVRWWFGLESFASLSAGEGERVMDPSSGPLGGYIPAGLRPDPSFRYGGKAFKPKYRFGYIGCGYNVLLADSEFRARRGWLGLGTPARWGQLENPARVVVFATSAQVNTFQRPASPSNPMIEEFYGLDENEITVHFRHRGQAMVVFADGNAGFLPMDPGTLDMRAPKAGVGRFAPAGSSQWLR